MKQFPQGPSMGDNDAAQRLYERMQADMQKVNNAANFARQVVFGAVDKQVSTSVTEASNMMDNGDAYLRLFASSMDFAMKMENVIENRVKAMTKGYENDPAILVPPRQPIIRPH